MHLMHPSFQKLFGSGLLLFLFCFLLPACGSKKAPEAAYNGLGPVKAENAAATFELEPGFKIELLAAEPLVLDPVDMEIDEYGRMYVVEMPGYPLDKTGSGRVRMLTDTDGDGQMDKFTDFATGLVLPNGVMRWKKGILVTDAPNVVYFEDTDNDGVSDVRDTLLTGFSLSNPHINVNNPLYGLDNWIHLAHLGAITTRNYENIFGDKGTEVYYPGVPNSPKLPKNADNHCVRFRPDQYLLEATSGRAQFGHTFDMWGHYLYGDNQNHASAVVIDAAYVNRNPELPVPGAVEAISDHGAAAEIFQITTNPERQMLSGVGTMTSASGIVSYTGGLFPAPFDKNLTFICESVSNLVHADKQRDSGATFASGRMGRPNHEFLASKDAWSRPVNLYVGPDGALYMVDYYRQIIEHPEWMSDEAVKAGGFYTGSDMGRIFRITPTGTPKADWTKGMKLGDATSKELVQYLAHKNSWWRTNAQRLLVDRGDKSIVPDLVALSKKEDSAEGRLHALWTLEGLNALPTELIEAALKDPVAGIRENAVKLAEIHLKAAPALETALLSLKNDADAKVRFQLLCTLGYLSSTAAADARNALLFQDINDKWVQMAALSAASLRSAPLLDMVLKNYKANVPAYGLLVQRLTTMIGAGSNKAAIHQLLVRSTSADSHEPWQASVLQGLADGLRNNPAKASLTNEQPLLVHTFFNHPSYNVRKATINFFKVVGVTNNPLFQKALAQAATIAADKAEPAELRTNAINFLALHNPAPQAQMLQSLILPQEDPSVQMAALQTLSLVKGLGVNKYVLQAWPQMSPSVRDAALNTFYSSPERINYLLDAVAAKKIPRTAIGWPRTSWLIGQDNDTIRNRSRALLIDHEQEAINKGYQQALQLQGDVANGRVVFQQNCGLCHQVRGQVGLKFGPDLGTIQNWLAKDIMANILAPNASIAVGFDLWSVKLKNGEALQGIIANETPGAITLRIAAGQEKLLSRHEIESLTVMNASAMPVLTSQINHQQMADLIAFLRQSN